MPEGELPGKLTAIHHSGKLLCKQHGNRHFYFLICIAFAFLLSPWNKNLIMCSGSVGAGRFCSSTGAVSPFWEKCHESHEQLRKVNCEVINHTRQAIG